MTEESALKEINRKLSIEGVIVNCATILGDGFFSYMAIINNRTYFATFKNGDLTFIDDSGKIL